MCGSLRLAEYPEFVSKAQVKRTRTELGFKIRRGRYFDASILERFLDVAVGKDHVGKL